MRRYPFLLDSGKGVVTSLNYVLEKLVPLTKLHGRTPNLWLQINPSQTHCIIEQNKKTEYKRETRTHAAG